MIDRFQLDRLSEAYPGFRELEPELSRRVSAEGAMFRARDRDVLFREEDFCSAFPLIVAGSARVVRSGTSGREIVLYHVRSGEYCLLSAVGLLAGSRLPARAIAEGRTSGVVVPMGLFLDIVRSSGGFHAELFGAIARRVEVLVRLIEQISVLTIDQRLAMLLLSRGRELGATHQDLALEIGCARENVSRALERFQRSGIVRLGRGRIDVLDAGPLVSIASAKDAVGERHAPARRTGRAARP